MQTHILLIIQDKNEQVAWLHKLQPACTIHVINSTGDIEQLLQNNFIQLVICNADSPKINGWKVCEQIKSSFHFSHIPVVLLAHSHNLQMQKKASIPAPMH